ncbi:unnamed protein product [Calypogeia fissa]
MRVESSQAAEFGYRHCDGPTTPPMGLLLRWAPSGIASAMGLPTPPMGLLLRWAPSGPHMPMGNEAGGTKCDSVTRKCNTAVCRRKQPRPGSDPEARRVAMRWAAPPPATAGRMGAAHGRTPAPPESASPAVGP